MFVDWVNNTCLNYHAFLFAHHYTSKYTLLTNDTSQLYFQYVDKKPGNFIDIDTDTVVGQHQGIHQWTVGQRANIAGKSKAYFIAKVNMQNQDIHVVGTRMRLKLSL